MTSISPQVTSSAPTTDQLIDRATSAGLRVCWTPPTYRRQAAYAHAAGTIWLRRDLTDAEARSLLAHELAHHHYGDDGEQPPPIEARAWRWAANLLIPECAYAAAERVVGVGIGALADQLDVTGEVIAAYRSILRRTS
ncbi:ImmA/IrrE family metallo-endopeptidase [Brachybacterium sp. NBEC-018]|uniref:ImmA/IrrE family metallo-endopeptidase n=1 Tax=Brachybacterium sp. NBEC-018 TaxID=2996004 RepID=UPI0021755277|nr:ImmA/IrrE family metallo-endopeptidase [Brachybacterium sp. NBEC-018]UVY83840.1 ImmA/IrrE family metallo-endopeptidase [Brachybacterium sp. NBEC-018]